MRTKSMVITYLGWRGNIKETIAKGWWNLNTERTDKDVALDSGEQRPRTPDEELQVKLTTITQDHKTDPKKRQRSRPVFLSLSRQRTSMIKFLKSETLKINVDFCSQFLIMPFKVDQVKLPTRNTNSSPSLLEAFCRDTDRKK
ncbi:hypothetical protein QTP88_018447 [Uroleucon formosanum]